MKVFKFFPTLVASLTYIIFSLTSVAVAEKPVHPGYPFVFDATGRIDRISDKEIVIDDSLFMLSAATTYHAPDTIFATSSSFKVKDFVGLIVKSKNSKEVISIWLIKRPE